MTKREICRKLLILNLDAAGIASAWGDWNYDLDAIDNAIRAAILNLVPDEAPDEEKPKAEEKHPGVIAKPGKDGEIEFCWCQKCYKQAAVVHDPFGDGENWSYCKTCGVSFRLKRKEGEK